VIDTFKSFAAYVSAWAVTASKSMYLPADARNQEYSNWRVFQAFQSSSPRFGRMLSATRATERESKIVNRSKQIWAPADFGSGECRIGQGGGADAREKAQKFAS
jgi:hypothetical protein